MRTGLSTIHQTLTPEASAVLDKSISEASRRRHSQTTPLHVASTLLSSSAGPLRRACARSHPNSTHPLQCRALDLCFSVALDRLPSSPPSPPSPPPLSNALMAALKRAQAHQRRGCPEQQQQQPLLAVKVELQHLIVSILDDPSVSRVMREASFSSPAVKAALEQPASPVPHLRPPVPNPTRILPLNPTRPTAAEEVGKVLDVLLRSRKRNPVLVGDSNPGILTREVLRRIEKNEGLHGTALENARILSPAAAEFLNRDSSEIPAKIRELTETIDTHSHDGGIVIDLGDLAWLVEPHHQHPQQQKLVPEAGRAAVAEVAAMLSQLEEKGRKAWVISSASCATFLRCQVYHPTMEADWDLQAIPVAPRAHEPSLHSPSTGILSSSVESLSQARASFSPALTAASAAAIPCEKLRPPADGVNMCRVCMTGYEKELAKLVGEQPEKAAASTLPQWLQAARANSPDWKLVNPTPPKIPGPGSHGSSIPVQIKARESQWKERADELLGRWRETCARLHPNANVIHPSLPTAAAVPRLQAAPEQHISPPRSPVGTELALGRPPELAHKTRVVNSSECTLDMSSVVAACDPGDDTFKRIYKSLLECVAWQPEAAASTAAALAGCKAGVARRRRNDTWLLFAGPDKVGKRKMAAALSEVVFGDRGGKRVLSVSVAGAEEGDSGARYWGKVALDRIADVVRRSPFAVYVLEDVDHADVLVQGSIRQAAEKGRLMDSHGREVSLCSAIFILTSTMLPRGIKAPGEDGVAAATVDEERRLEAAAGHQWKIELSVAANTAIKRHPEWLKLAEERQTRQKIDQDVNDGKLSLDLNLAVGGGDEELVDSSRNSSDVTVELDRAHDRGHLPTGPQKCMLPDDLVGTVEPIVFKNVDFSPLKQMVADIIRAKFEMVMGADHAVAVEGEALDGLAGALWFGESATAAGFEDWAERMLVPSFWQLKNRGLAEELWSRSVVKLVAVKDSCKPWEVGWLPDRISVISNR